MATFLGSILILLSFILIIAVPVAIATPGQWEKSKKLIFNTISGWGAIVLLTGLSSGT